MTNAQLVAAIQVANVHSLVESHAWTLLYNDTMAGILSDYAENAKTQAPSQAKATVRKAIYDMIMKGRREIGVGLTHSVATQIHAVLAKLGN